MISDFLGKSADLNLRQSKIESDRFGISVARLSIPLDSEASDFDLARLCASSDSKLLIVRYSTLRIKLSELLSSIKGRSAVHADTLVYFSRDISNLGIENSQNSAWNFEIATLSDEVSLEKLAREGFRDYPSHYSSNSLLSAAQIHEGYVEWALSGVRNEDNLTVLVKLKTGETVGFALAVVAGNQSEFVLSCVSPRFEGQGIYSAIVFWLVENLPKFGGERIYVSTQIQNTRVIRAWIKAGFNLDFSLNTYHLIERGI